MATSRIMSGKSNAFTSNTLNVLNEDVLFSVLIDFHPIAIPPLFALHVEYEKC